MRAAGCSPPPKPAHRRGCLLECDHPPFGGHYPTIAVSVVQTECTYYCQRRPKRGTGDEHDVYGGSRLLFSSPKRQPCQHQTHIYNRYHNKDIYSIFHTTTRCDHSHVNGSHVAHYPVIHKTTAIHYYEA